MSDVQKLSVFAVALIALFIWAKSPFKWEESKPLPKVTSHTEVDFKSAFNAALYSKVSTFSKADLNSQYVYKALVKIAYPKLYKENENNNFALHSMVSDAVHSIKDDTFFDNTVYSDRGKEFYSYNPVILGVYDFNNGSLPFRTADGVELPFNASSTEEASQEKIISSSNGLVSEGFYYVNGISNRMSIKLDQKSAESLKQYAKEFSKNKICMRFKYRLDSLDRGYLQLRLVGWEYEPDNSLCGIKAQTK
jgi:hypothetical protein